MVRAQLHFPAWRISKSLRGILLIGLVGGVSVAVAATLSNARTETAVPPAFETTNGAHVTVSALPGVDLGPVMALPGVSASSGPFPTLTTGARHGRHESDLRLEARPSRRSAVERPVLLSGTWARAGSVVLDQRLARALEVRPGSHVTVSSASGPVSIRVAGTILGPADSHKSAGAGLGYVTPRTLTRLAPNEHTQGSKLYLRIADPDRSKQYAAWIRRRYPGPQVTVAEWRRLQATGGAGSGLVWLGALAAVLGTAAVVSRKRRVGRKHRVGHGSPTTSAVPRA